MTTGEPEPTVLVVDFGAQYAQLIARRVREAHVRSEIVASNITPAEIRTRRPIGLILSGGPASVYAEDANRMDPEVLELGIPDRRELTLPPGLCPSPVLWIIP